MTIEEYLAELRLHLKVGPLAKLRILREIEDHLVESASSRGEEAAIAELGSAQLVAQRFEHERARPRWTRRAAAFAVGTIVATAIAVPTVLLTGGTQELPPGPLGKGTIAALDANPAASELVPGSGLLASFQGHRVLTDPERALWVARGKGGGSICLVSEESSGVVTDCGGRAVLRRGPMWVIFQRSQNSGFSLVGLVDDAVTSVRGPNGDTFQVRHNAFAFDGIHAASGSLALKLYTAKGARTFEIKLPPPMRPPPAVSGS